MVEVPQYQLASPGKLNEVSLCPEPRPMQAPVPGTKNEEFNTRNCPARQTHGAQGQLHSARGSLSGQAVGEGPEESALLTTATDTEVRGGAPPTRGRPRMLGPTRTQTLNHAAGPRTQVASHGSGAAEPLPRAWLWWLRWGKGAEAHQHLSP